MMRTSRGSKVDCSCVILACFKKSSNRVLLTPAVRSSSRSRIALASSRLLCPVAAWNEFSSEANPASLNQTVLGTKLRDCLFGFPQLLAQHQKAIAEPCRSALCRLEPGVQLVDEIGVRDAVGQPRRPQRIGRGDRDGENKASL